MKIEVPPALPTKRKHKEADVTPAVLAWFEKHYPRSCAIEIKYGKNILLEHQITALTRVKKGSFSYKIPDMGRKNPFDAVYLKNADAIVVRCENKKCTAVVNDVQTFSFILRNKKG